MVFNQEVQSPLKIQELVKAYGDFKAVDKVSLDLKSGEIFGLLGPNGAGKTSIISCIVGLTQPTQGFVQVFSRDVVKEWRFRAAVTGYVGQELINHGFFTVAEVLAFHAGFYGVRRSQDWINFLLERLQLAEHRGKLVKQLSGGMKRRLMIAKALVHKPRLLLLDEPTAGVDIELRNSLWEFVRELREGGMTILLTTHYLEEAEIMCDRVGILYSGRLCQLGPTAELIRNFTQRIVTVTCRSAPKNLVHPQILEVNSSEVKITLPQGRGLGELLMEIGVELPNISDIKVREGSLEDVFLHLLGREKNG